MHPWLDWIIYLLPKGDKVWCAVWFNLDFTSGTLVGYVFGTAPKYNRKEMGKALCYIVTELFFRLNCIFYDNCLWQHICLLWLSPFYIMVGDYCPGAIVSHCHSCRSLLIFTLKYSISTCMYICLMWLFYIIHNVFSWWLGHRCNDLGSAFCNLASNRGLDQLEENSQQKPSSCDSDCCQDGRPWLHSIMEDPPFFFLFWLCWIITNWSSHVIGDSAPTDRQLSPRKLHRVAVLKNRFADTIFKAREKTLTQVCYKFELPRMLELALLIFPAHWYICMWSFSNLILRLGW